MQRDASKDKESLFSGKHTVKRPEENDLLETEQLELDDDIDDDLPLIEFARRSLKQARSDAPRTAIRASDGDDEHDDEDEDVMTLSQDGILQVRAFMYMNNHSLLYCCSSTTLTCSIIPVHCILPL